MVPFVLNVPFHRVADLFTPFQVIDETLDVKEMIFNAERVGGLETEPVGVQLQSLTARVRVALGCSLPPHFKWKMETCLASQVIKGPRPHFSMLLDKRARIRISVEMGKSGSSPYGDGYLESRTLALPWVQSRLCRSLALMERVSPAVRSHGDLVARLLCCRNPWGPCGRTSV